jgi:hypothetical protein
MSASEGITHGCQARYLQSERMGHEVPGIRGGYSHVSLARAPI